ncbi:hypothetical protein O181_078484 [Austropuccinia psidii MF-1]|uniref:Anthranilate phosphoribosyltransferase n=1 Tax=Austropuccinia psidii MF-1 TaxID=1389203 RepID=A0A9Q3FGL9_9BASI|nr:hypothetical protein [Austropuccinia psidii MF-1]
MDDGSGFLLGSCSFDDGIPSMSEFLGGCPHKKLAMASSSFQIRPAAFRWSLVSAPMASTALQPSLRRIVEFSQGYLDSNSSSDDLTILEDLKTAIKSLNDDNDSYPVQFSSLLTALAVSGLDKNEKVIQTFVQEILSGWNLGRGSVDQRPSHANTSTLPICDIVGTGGDGFNTFNVSTTVAIVAAGAGVKVCKHGNRASSSASGSADLLMALGVPLQKLQPSHVAKLVQDPEMNFNFLFSPTFYPIFARLSPIRKTLGFPTIFNLLGPLLNPARPDRLLIGVTKPALGPIFCRVLKLCGLSHSWVVCSEEGLDEISTAGETSLWKLASDGSITHQRLSPQTTFGLPSHPLSKLIGESAQDNLNMLHDLLDGRFETDRHRAILDFVLINTSAFLVLAGKTDDFKEGVRLAKSSLLSGKAKAAIYRFRDHAQELARATC